MEYVKSILIGGNAIYQNYFSIAEIFHKNGKMNKSLIFYQLFLKDAEKHLKELKQRANQKDADVINFISQKCDDAKQKIKELSE